LCIPQECSFVDITDKVIENCLNKDTIEIPSGDANRAKLFGDPYLGTLKNIFIEEPDGTTSMYSSNLKIKINNTEIQTEFCWRI
jgi:hypothetical protein